MRVLTMVAAALAANLGYAQYAHGQDHATHDHSQEQLADEDVAEFVVEPHRVLVQVRGIVCSFCAWGAEKSLAQLDGLDRTAFGNGVLVNIHTHRITIAMGPGNQIPIHEIYRRIKKAGYDPVIVYARISGTLEAGEESLLLRDTESGQVFSIMDGNVEDLAPGDRVDIQVHVDGHTIPSLSESRPIEVTVDHQFSQAGPNHE